MRHSPLPADADLPGRPVLGFVACGAVVRKAAFLAVSGFHPRLVIGSEEHLLALDLATAGWGLAYVDELVAHHHPERREGRDGRGALTLRNELWIAWLRRRLPAALAATARLTARALRERELGAVGAALRGLPWVLRERAPVPARVERAARMLGL